MIRTVSHADAVGLMIEWQAKKSDFLLRGFIDCVLLISIASVMLCSVLITHVETASYVFVASASLFCTINLHAFYLVAKFGEWEKAWLQKHASLVSSDV